MLHKITTQLVLMLCLVLAPSCAIELPGSSKFKMNLKSHIALSVELSAREILPGDKLDIIVKNGTDSDFKCLSTHVYLNGEVTVTRQNVTTNILGTGFIAPNSIDGIEVAQNGESQSIDESSSTNGSVQEDLSGDSPANQSDPIHALLRPNFDRDSEHSQKICSVTAPVFETLCSLNSLSVRTLLAIDDPSISTQMLCEGYLAWQNTINTPSPGTTNSGNAPTTLASFTFNYLNFVEASVDSSKIDFRVLVRKMDTGEVQELPARINFRAFLEPYRIYLAQQGANVLTSPSGGEAIQPLYNGF